MRRNNKTSLSLNLTYYRKKANLTQAQVASALGIDRSTYAYYESGSTPRPEILFKLAEIYRISAGKFLDSGDGNVASSQEIFGDIEFMQSFNELSDREKALILKFRAFSDAQKNTCEKSLNAISEKENNQ